MKHDPCPGFSGRYARETLFGHIHRAGLFFIVTRGVIASKLVKVLGRGYLNIQSIVVFVHLLPLLITVSYNKVITMGSASVVAHNRRGPFQALLPKLKKTRGRVVTNVRPGLLNLFEDIR